MLRDHEVKFGISLNFDESNNKMEVAINLQADIKGIQ